MKKNNILREHTYTHTHIHTHKHYLYFLETYGLEICSEQPGVNASRI